MSEPLKWNCGHPKTPENTIRKARGKGRPPGTRCRQCEYKRVNAWAARSRGEVSKVRIWAISRGYDVAAVGRIPAHIWEAYYDEKEGET